MRTVNNYRGLKVYVFEPDEEIPGWVIEELGADNVVTARGKFTTPAILARVLDRFIDEELNAEADRRAGGPPVPGFAPAPRPAIPPRPPPGGPAPRPGGPVR